MTAWLAFIAMTSPDPSAPSSPAAREAKEMIPLVYAQIEADYWNAETKLYRDAWKEGENLSQPAFNWGVGVMLSGLNGAARFSPEIATRLPIYLQSNRLYWNQRPPVAGFDVLPNPGGVDRYYDDNAWMVIALVESYEITKDVQWLDLAEQALLYVASGEDEKLGGGIYWRESDKASKNTCSNTPSAVAALQVYKHRKKPEYRAMAERWLRWTLTHLQDPSDGRMWDNMSLDGKIEKTKWSYNSALTIRAQAALEKEGETFPISAKKQWESAWDFWFLGKKGMLSNGRFAHLLLETGLELGWISAEDQLTLVRALRKYGEPHAWRFGPDWDKPFVPGARAELIDQASVLRGLALIAQQGD